MLIMEKQVSRYKAYWREYKLIAAGTTSPSVMIRDHLLYFRNFDLFWSIFELFS